MGEFAQEKKLILGDEHDESLRAVLLSVLKQMGGGLQSREWGLGGSQELATLEVEIGGRVLLVESETYVGLSITGDEALIDEVASAVQERRGH